MNKARSIGLAVQYRSTPYSTQVQASAQVDAAEGGGSAASSAISGSGAAAGQAVTLNNTPLYVSAWQRTRRPTRRACITSTTAF